jgi:hypothetical protein
MTQREEGRKPADDTRSHLVGVVANAITNWTDPLGDATSIAEVAVDALGPEQVHGGYYVDFATRVPVFRLRALDPAAPKGDE